MENGIYDHGKYPFVFDVLFPEKDSPAGFGYVDIMKDAQISIDNMWISFEKNVKQQAEPRYFRKQGAGINDKQFADLSNSIVDYVGDPNDIIPIQVNPVSGIATNLYQLKIDELKETSANRDFSQGSTASGVTAASAIAALQEAGSKTSRDMIKASYRAYVEVVSLVVELIRQFYDLPREFRITGVGGDTFVSYDNSNIKPQPMETVMGVEVGGRKPIFDIKITSQKSSPFSRIAQNELAKELYGAGLFNPELVDQALMMNEFKGYSKYYMIGGSASWANIRGFLSHNIEGLHLLEEGSWKAPNTDVWGLSDLDLFREAAAALTKSPKPFVAVIQTAGFHRPYTIPEDNAGFQIKQPSEAILKNYGFTGADEYNSLRFSDHSLGEFFKIARQQPWFDNTVFAIFGDHGLNDTSLNMSPGYLACRLQSNHTPMLIYAPGLVAAGKLQPGVDGRPCGQPDIFPTLASLAGIPYRYNAMGRNLLDPDTKRDEMQFLGGETESTVRLVENGYCYIRETDEHMYKMDAPVLEDLLNTDPERAAHMRQYAQDFYNASKYLLYNNKKFD